MIDIKLNYDPTVLAAPWCSLTVTAHQRLGKDFSHPLEMTNKTAEAVISNEERDLSELHHYPLPVDAARTKYVCYK